MKNIMGGYILKTQNIQTYGGLSDINNTFSFDLITSGSETTEAEQTMSKNIKKLSDSSTSIIKKI